QVVILVLDDQPIERQPELRVSAQPAGALRLRQMAFHFVSGGDNDVSVLHQRRIQRGVKGLTYAIDCRINWIEQTDRDGGAGGYCVPAPRWYSRSGRGRAGCYFPVPWAGRRRGAIPARGLGGLCIRPR